MNWRAIAWITTATDHQVRLPPFPALPALPAKKGNLNDESKATVLGTGVLQRAGACTDPISKANEALAAWDKKFGMPDLIGAVVSSAPYAVLPTNLSGEK